MGEVYRARDTRLDRTVEIKVLPSAFSGDAALRQRLERDARAVSALDHPNIGGLYDVGAENGVDLIVMQFLTGETPAARLARSPLSVDEVCTAGAQIADGRADGKDTVDRRADDRRYASVHGAGAAGGPRGRSTHRPLCVRRAPIASLGSPPSDCGVRS